MEWISIKDKIPEENVHVLATNKEFIIVAEITRWGLRSIICTCCDSEYRDEFTHWMPLPELPNIDA